MPERRELADLLVEALGPGREGSLVRALCQEFLRGALEGPSPPETFEDLERVLCARAGGRGGDRDVLLWTVRGITHAQPGLRLSDFARGYRERRGPPRPGVSDGR